MKIFAVTAVLCLAIGIAAIVVNIVAGENADPPVRRYDLRALVAGIGFIVAGAYSGWLAVRIAANKIKNEDL